MTAWVLLGSLGARAQVIVVNNTVTVSEISKSDVRDIFTGAATTFKNGSRALPATLKSGPLHEEFLKSYVGKDNTAFRAAWRATLFAGQATIPPSFDTEADLIDYVASKPGAIGYVSTAPASGKVKSLTVK